jgi:hypothetical protein
MENFLNEATQNKVLKLIREETTPKNFNEVEEDTLVEEGGMSDDDDDDTTVSDRPKKQTRRVSKTLLNLIYKHFPSLKAKCKNDATCLYMLVKDHVGKFPKNLDEYKKQLEQIAVIGNHMHPSTSTVRNYFSDLAGLFKVYWVQRGESDRFGTHVTIVRETLHAETSRVKQYLAEKELKLTEALKNKYHVQFESVQQKMIKLYNDVMLSNELAHTLDERIGLLIAIETSAGMRKGAILDPNVKFQTYSQFKRANKDTPFRIGLDNDQSIKLDELEDMENVLVQTGVLKDAETSINKYLKDDNDDRYVMDRVLIKPTIILTAKQVVDGIATFRQMENITKKTFVSRRVSSNNFGRDRIKIVMKKTFPAQAAKAARENNPFGTHFCRKIYANASFEIYKEQVRLVTNKYIDRSVWMAAVLGHGGSIKTSLSYSNVIVDFDLPVEAYKVPDFQVIRNMQAQIEVLTNMYKELRKEFEQRAPTDMTVNFVATDGKTVNLNKHKRGDGMTVQAAMKMLTDNNVVVTNNNLKKLGFGKRAMKSRNEVQNLKSSNEVQNEPEQQGRIPLPPNTKVIIKPRDNPKNTTQYLKRQREMFGEDNLILEGKCEGTVLKQQKLAKNTFRDLCKDK